MNQLHHLLLPAAAFLLLNHPPPSSQSTTQITPYKFHLSFKPKPKHHTPNPQQQQTPASDRMLSPDGVVSFPATIVPKLFGDKPWWVPHAYFNLCPFVRGPDIDPVWAAGCNPMPYPDLANFNNYQDMVFRLQALQQQQLQGQVPQQSHEPSWYDSYRPSGPIDFGMANMYGPVVQQEMHSEYDASATGGSRRGSASPVSPLAALWGGGSGFWG